MPFLSCLMARPLPRRPRLRPALVSAVLLIATCGAGRAQDIQQYFPAGVPGYDEAPGVTVRSRERPLYDAPGVHLGAFLFRPQWAEGIGYDSNVTGLAGGPGSALVRSAAAVSAASLWQANRLAAEVSADDRRYLDAPRQSFTNWTAALGGTLGPGRDALTVSFAHFTLNETAAEVGALRADTPIRYDVEDVRASYAARLGRLTLTPGLAVQAYDFTSAVVLGVPVSQAYRDRIVLTGSLAARMPLSDQRSLLILGEGIGQDYTHPAAGQPSPNSQSALVLAGIDYQADGPWRYRLLLGVETRLFSASAFHSHTAPIAAAEAIWMPTGMTTVTALLSRTIEDPSAEGSSGYTYTVGRLVLDHELKRNVLLQGRASYQVAEYYQGGGTRAAVTLGAGVTWLVNPFMRLSGDYAFTDQTEARPGTYGGGPNVTTLRGGAFTRNVALLTIRLGL